ncbi:NAD(P)-binding protein [Amniculicola lignicola CBS 123094]|uniref:NAD(P)-binding protein n=1 Tax=Amniculicola lignicola CBS 123094 TaxID=1392246 RepID=A0A6A5WLI9_9PLEO|nr:NAD(P)-binding protein [Amniculicola lignicola CBS 123094]
MRNVVIIGATRGLGASLVNQYSATPSINVHGTARYTAAPHTKHNVQWISNIDIGHEGAGRRLASLYMADGPIDLLIICASYFLTESLHDLHWNKELDMYTTNVIGPVFLINHLVHAGLLKKGSRIVLVGSESGSIALKTLEGGGGNYGGNGSKAALNMAAKLLSIDLKEKEISVVVVHTGYLRKQNKDGEFDVGGVGAVKPDVAAASLKEWIQTSYTPEISGQFWAIRGTADIKTAEAVLGPRDALPVPLQLPY